MLFKHNASRNDRNDIRKIVRGGCLAISFALLSGCSLPHRSLLIWRQTAEFENVARFRFDRETSENQWFTRLIEDGKLPSDCVHPLSDKFSFVMIKSASEWSQLVEATNLQRNLKTPALHKGIVVGILAQAGETRSDRWPALITSARQRGSVVFLVAEFFQGYYRPLEVPPYLHLVYIPEARHVLGLKINHQLFGFNVDIADLNAVGIH